jgi:predicted adenylyl cyclase CyaB
MFENVRIHLDHVDGLGTFVEFEAVLEQAVDQRVSLERLASLKSALHIHDQHCIDVSYSDLIDPRPKE